MQSSLTPTLRIEALASCMDMIPQSAKPVDKVLKTGVVVSYHRSECHGLVKILVKTESEPF